MEQNPTDILLEVLEEMGYVQGETIFLHGSIEDDLPYPDSFWTFRNYNNEFRNYRDNKPMQTDWTYSLNFYSNNPTIIDSQMLEAVEKLQERGFIVQGKGYDAISDEKTHTGKENTLIYREDN